jgi:translocation and assembly module TamB
MSRPARALVILIATAAFALANALAQDGEETSGFVAFLENLISTPDRQVSITGLEGALSSNPTVERLTVSDREGPWLELEGVEVVWSRAALLRRTLDIESLRARQVTMLRRPAPTESDEAAGGGGMPVAVTIDSISLPLISVAAPVAGAGAELAATGSATLTQEELAAQLSIFRQDRAGALNGEFRFQPEANTLIADLTLEEPAGGLLAELLDLPNRPPISARLSGNGPLDSWNATLQVKAGDAEVLNGSMALNRDQDGYHLVSDMSASLESVVPPEYAALVAGRSQLTLDAARATSGVVTVRTARLRSAGMEAAANGTIAADFVPEAAEVSVRVGQAGRTALPFAPGEISLAALQVDAALERGDTAPWRIGIVAEGVESTYGSFARLVANGSGQAGNLASPAERRTSFQVSGAVEEIAATDPDMRAVIGSDIEFAADGAWAAGQPVSVENSQLVLGEAAISFTGTATAQGLEGRYGATIMDLRRFAAIAGRPISGGARIEATGTAAKAGLFALQVEGETTDLGLGVTALDPLLAGATTVRGGVSRSDEGALSFDAFSLVNDRVSAEIDGALAGPELDLAVNADVSDLSLVTERAAGKAHVTATLAGTSAAPRIAAEVTGEQVLLMGRPFSDASARFSGTIAGPETFGEAAISGTLGEARVEGSARLAAAENGARRLEDFVFSVGESRASGDLIIGADNMLSGDISVISPDLSQVAPLFLAEASGMVRADITLSSEGGSQSATVSGIATDLVYETVRLQTAEIDGRARDLFSQPEIDGSFSIRNLVAGGLTVVTADGTAERRGDATVLSAKADLADGRATLQANLAPEGQGMGIGLQAFSFQRSGANLALAAPTTIVVENGGASFDNATLNAGGGSATISGRAGQTLDLAIGLNAIPAALANSVSPTLAAEGTVSGTVTMSGTAADPAARFDIAMVGASVAASRNAGLGPLNISSRGELTGGTVRLSSNVNGSGGLSVDVSGTVGTAQGAPLDVAVTGSVPLSLGNRQLAERGAALSGALQVNIRVGGTAAAPQFSGSVTSEGGGFVDPESGIVLSNLSLSSSVSNNRLVIDRLNAASGDGTVTAGGSIGLDPSEGFPVDLSIQVNQARYVDGTLIASRFDADLDLTGKLAGAPVLVGEVFLDRTEITVPERLPGDSVAVDVAHVAPPPPVERTLAAVRQPNGRSGGGAGGPSGIMLDITLRAPQQVFVRGRGLDTEFGGRVQLKGPISSVVTSGSFEIVRGRLDILTQRILLDRGTITFAGDLDPILDFIGTTTSGDVTITVTISGRASDPEVNFSSIPELPQDEVLAQLIFQKGIGELSPLQIARLGAAAAELSGGSGGGVLAKLRESTGLDDLDIVVDEEGQAALAAGRYVSENVYIGVQQGTTAESSKVTIDLDITKGVKARAGYSVEGESSLGIFFEREY